MGLFPSTPGNVRAKISIWWDRFREQTPLKRPRHWWEAAKLSDLINESRCQLALQSLKQQEDTPFFSKGGAPLPVCVVAQLGSVIRCQGTTGFLPCKINKVLFVRLCFCFGVILSFAGTPERVMAPWSLVSKGIGQVIVKSGPFVSG